MHLEGKIEQAQRWIDNPTVDDSGVGELSSLPTSLPSLPLPTVLRSPPHSHSFGRCGGGGGSSSGQTLCAHVDIPQLTPPLSFVQLVLAAVLLNLDINVFVYGCVEVALLPK